MLDKLIEFDNGLIGYNSIDKSDLDFIQQIFRELNRTPAIYLPTDIEARSLPLLLTNGYKCEFTDSWLFYSGLDIDKSQFAQVKSEVEQS